MKQCVGKQHENHEILKVPVFLDMQMKMNGAEPQVKA